MRFARVLCVFAALSALPFLPPVRAAEQVDQQKGERILQAFFTLWSRDDGVTRANVEKLYAPQLIYYGKPFSREGVLREKLQFAHHWPQRDYREVPGSLRATCDPSGVRCTLRALITWRRATRSHEVTTGRAELRLEFAGDRKITRESARIL